MKERIREKAIDPLAGHERRLLSLSELNDNLEQSIFSSDRQIPFDTLVQETRRFFSAEACALFLVSDETAHELVIEASCGELQPLDYWKGMRIKIQSVPKGGLTGHIASQQSVVALAYDQLKSNQFVRHKHQDHLVNGWAFSYMGIPLRDRKQRLLGVLTLDNKKNPGCPPDNQTFFDRADKDLATMLARKVVFFLENLRCFEVFRGIMEDIQQEAADLDRLLYCLLKRAVGLLRADRGDFALWDVSRQDLFIRAVAGPIHKRTLGVGSTVPAPSFMRMVWADKGEADLAKSCPDVNEIKPNYYKSDHRTKSEIAVRLVFQGRPRGVLNLESFQRNGFDDQDMHNLLLLARYADIAVEIADQESHLGNIIQRVFDHVGPSQMALRSILDTVREVYSFQAGLIYVADNDSKMLRCRAALGCDGLTFDPTAFSIPYDETSAATTVLHTKEGFYSADPAHDAGVCQRTRRRFKINTPLVGVPLIFGDVAVGVLVVWGAKTPPPTREHIVRLKPLAKLAAWKLAVWESQRRLSQTEDLYRSLVESLPKDVYLLRKDLDGRFTFANSALLASLGVQSLDRIVGRTDADFYPSDLAAKYRQDDEEVVKKGQPISGRFEMHRFPKGKRSAMVMVSKTAVRDGLAKIVGVQAIFWDITDHHTLEQRFRQLVDLSMNAILVHNGKKITFVNPACLALLGAGSPSDLVGRDVLSIVQQDDQALVRRRIHDMRKHDDTQPLAREKWLRVDGTVVNVHVAARPFFSVKGFEVLVVAQDITGWKREQLKTDFYENALGQSSKPKQVFICYSHKDDRHKDRLCTYLDPLRRKGINIWLDQKLSPGAKWQDAIRNALARAGAAILLVSADFKASGYIQEVELPLLLKAAEKNQTRILPVAVGRCDVAELKEFQWVNDPNRPLDEMRPPKRNVIWKKVVEQVEAAFGLQEWPGAGGI